MTRVCSIVVVVVAAVAAGCDAGDCNSVEPAYAGEATDESWRVMLDARGNAEASDDVSVTVPDDGAEVTIGDDPPSLAWDSELEVALHHDPRDRANPLQGRSASTRPRPTRSFLDDLSAVVFPRAHAHLPPITSDLYLLEIDVPGRTCPVSGLTTLESMIFADGDWEEVTKEPGERTLRLLSAFVTQNRITEGPFTSTPVTFTVVE